MASTNFSPLESQNIIFIDTEFSSLDPEVGEVLSIGIVKSDGAELYLELKHDGEVSEWVAKHIIPTLSEIKLTPKQAVQTIREFLGETNPYAIAYVDNYDLIYLTKLFGVGKLPFRWMTIDMTSVLFTLGKNPVKYAPDQPGASNAYKKLGIDLKKYRKHHALDDAKLLRELWLKLLPSESDEVSSGV